MERLVTNLEKDATFENSRTHNAIESRELKGESLISKSCRRKSNPSKTLMLVVQRSKAIPSSKGLYLRNINRLRSSIPKSIATLDEKYVLRCLESIHNCALKRAAAWNLTLKVDNSPHGMSSLPLIKGSNIMVRSAIEYPLIGKTDLVMSSFCDWTLGTLSSSQAMINILRSPLLQNFGSLDFKSIRNTDLLDMDQRLDSDFTDSRQELCSNSFIQKEVKEVLDRKYLSETVHKRDVSISSTSSSFSDQSSSSSCSESFQGMLQSTWKDGLIRHVFSMDDKKEVYSAKLSKVESLGGKKGVDCIYTFYSLASSGKKDCDLLEPESEGIAEMHVSTSIESNCNNLEIRETRFILSVSSENLTGKVKNSNYAFTQNKKLTEKVVDIFKFSHSHKLRSNSLLDRSSSTLKDACLGLYEELHKNHHNSSPKLELAAVVVKEVRKIQNKAGLGGWGMKFLKKRPSLETFCSSIFSQDNGPCSTSMDVIIPVGFHGGPRTRGGGPSGLIERWMAGGKCDCGGWDVGCPLRILKSTSNGADFSFGGNNCGECKPVDLFMQGSKQNAPIMKLVNFHDGLCYIHFQSTLSSLQSFAIAAAIIHSRTPVFRSKVHNS